MWQARFAFYLAGALGGAATIATLFGYGTYDPATGMFDLAPIDIKAAAGGVVSVVSSALAAVATIRGWARR